MNDPRIDDSLAAVFDPQRMFDFPDPYPVFAQLRRRPVMRVEIAGRPSWVLARYDDVATALRDQTGFCAPSIGAVVLGRSRRSRAESHARTRALAAPAFAARAADPLRRFVEALVGEQLDRLAGADRADLVSAFATPVPIQVLAPLIGVPAADYPRLLEWSHDLLGSAKAPARARAALQSLERYLAPMLRARRTEPRDDLVSRLVTGTADGQSLNDAEIIGFLQMLLPAAADPPMQLVANMLVALLIDRDRFERVRQDRSLVRWAVEETLRWEAPIVFVVRQVTRDLDIGGVTMAPSENVCVVIGSANRDERRYAEPERFDLDRHADDHLSFSVGRHACLGSYLGRLVARVALEGLLDRVPRLRLDPAAEPPAITGVAFRWPERLAVRFDA